MSDGRVIEGRIAVGRARTLCVLTGVEARALARRFPHRPVAEVLEREAAWEAEAARRAFVRKLWGNARRPA